MSGGGHGGGNRPVQVLIVLVLIAIVFGLHFVATPQIISGFNSGSLLAFGFVVLASFTIGKLAPVIRIPHITGYLLAGMVFGPSIPHLIEGAAQSAWFTSLFGNVELHLLAPFDRGIIDEDTVGFLSILDTLAIALIALTAGGELKIDSLKKGLNGILGALVGQTVLIFLFITPLVWAIMGGVPAISLPGIQVSNMVGIALGLVVSVISVATSPAATIAVINEQGAEGPMTRTVLPAVVMKDIVVVVGFSLASLFALTQMGQASDQNIGMFLLVNIGGALAVGAALGWLMALYLQYVGKEVLLVIIAVVYASTLMAAALELDAMLLFLAAGFTASNFSREGDNLIHNVERLSMPVYVVFFTLAGAKLHLSEVIEYFGYAAALVSFRIFAIWLGVKIGLTVANSPEPVKKHAWLGFLSQAGVAISLSSLVGEKFGEIGQTLQTLLIAGVAINEIIGPVLLEKGLQRAGETGKRFQEDDGRPEEEEPGESEEAEKDEPTQRISIWPETTDYNPWETPLDSRSEVLREEYAGFSAQLEAIVLGAAKGPVRRFHLSAQDFVRELRRDFLRHHRRLTVHARTGTEDLAHEVRVSESELVMRWRGTVLHRADELRSRTWNPAHLVETLDRIVEKASPWIKVAYEPQSYQANTRQAAWLAIRRTALNARRISLKMFGSEPKRGVPFRGLARYHFSGATPQRLEAVATLLVRAEDHLTRRMREILNSIVQGYARMAEGTVGPGELEEMRKTVEHDFQIAQDEVDRIGGSLSGTLARVFGESLADLRDDLMVAGTLDLSSRARRSSRVFHDRIKAIQRLESDLPLLRQNLGGGHALLSLELELRELEAVARTQVTEHTHDLVKALRGKGFTQAELTHDLLNAALDKVKEHLESPQPELGDDIIAILGPLEKRVHDAAVASSELHEQFVAEEGLGALVEGLRKASQALSEHYTVPNGHLEFESDIHLPKPTGLVDVRFRELVLGLTESSIGPELVTAAAEMGAQVLPLSTSLNELERVISIKTELLKAELEAVDADQMASAETIALVRDVVFSGLQRTEEGLSQQLEISAEWPVAFPRKLRSIVSEGVEGLHAQLSEGEFDPDRLGELRRRVARQRFLRRAGSIPSLLRGTRLVAIRTVRGLIGAGRFDYWWRSLGFPVAEPGQVQREELAAPTTTDVPLAYRRLFVADALDLRSSWAKDVEKARLVLTDRTSGLRTVALVGPEGVGKGPLCRTILRSRAWKNVERVALTEPTDAETLEEMLDHAWEGRLMVVTGLHWLMSLKPGGFEPIRLLADRVIRDAGKNSWMLLADEPVWSLACEVAPLAEAFPDPIKLSPLSADALESAVLARHALSGYALNFEPQVIESRVEAIFARGAGRIRRPYEAFFHSLHDSSGGLVRDAFRLWTAAVERVDEKSDLVHIGSVPRSPQPVLRRLPEPVLVNLYQASRQGWLDAESQASLYRVDAATGAAQLARLARLGLLERNKDVYRVSAHLRGPLYRVLSERGWI